MQGAESSIPRKTQDRVLTVVFLTVFLDMIGFGLILPLLPLYVSGLGGSAQTVGFIFSSFAFTQLIATPILGRISDRYGRRPVILLSLAGNAASMFLFAMADQLWLLFLSRILAGATSANLSACQAAVADVTSREERARGMGRLGAGIGLGLVLGPFLGGVLARFGTWAPPTAAAVMALIDLVLAYFWMPETRKLALLAEPAPLSPEPMAAAIAPARTALPPSSNSDVPSHPPQKKTSLWATLSEPQLARVMALYFLSFFCLTNMQVALALLANVRFGWGEQQIGYIFGAFGLVTFIVQGALIGRLTRLMGEMNMVLSGAVSGGIGLLVIGTAHQPWMVILGSMLFALGMAVNNPAVSSLASRFARDDQQGLVMGFAQSAGGLARALGPSWSGFLFARISPAAPFFGGAITAVLWLLVGQSLKKWARDDALEATGTAASNPATDPKPLPD